ncbi:hypothetical protein ACU686_40230 [Yinghuangia aomiensis]
MTIGWTASCTGMTAGTPCCGSPPPAGRTPDMRGQLWPAAAMNTEFTDRELITHAKADCQGRPAVYMLAQSTSEPVVDSEAAFRALVRTLAAQAQLHHPRLGVTGGGLPPNQCGHRLRTFGGIGSVLIGSA